MSIINRTRRNTSTVLEQQAIGEYVRHIKQSTDCSTILYYHPTLEYIANEMLEFAGHKLIRGNIQWKQFNDDWPDLFIENTDLIKNNHIVYLASLDHHSTLFIQYCILTHFSKYSCASLKVLIPYFGCGTMERIGRSGEVASAFSLSQLLSSLPLNKNGLTELCVLDIHSLANQFYFDSNKVLIRMETTIGLLLNELRIKYNNDIYNTNKIGIVFPDDGAYKRFGHFFSEINRYELIICSKIRMNGKKFTNIKQGHVEGLHCIIVDDLVQSGGTLIECGHCIVQAGAQSVSAFVAHAIFPKDEYKQFLYNKHDSNNNNNTTTTTDSNIAKLQFDTFYVTNSLPRTNELVGKHPFKVLSIAKLLTSICYD